MIRILGIDPHRQNVVFIPNPFRIDNHPAGLDIVFHVAAEAFDIVGRGLNGYYQLGSRGERLAREDADVRSAIQNDVAPADEFFAVSVDLPFLLCKIEMKGKVARGRNPERAFRSLPEVVAGGILVQDAAGFHNLVFDGDLTVVFTHAASGLIERTPCCPSGQGERTRHDPIMKDSANNGQDQNGKEEPTDSTSHKFEYSIEHTLVSRIANWIR